MPPSAPVDVTVDPTVDAAVARLLDGARRPAVVVTDLAVHLAATDAAEVTVCGVSDELPEGPRTVVVVTADAETLRSDVTRAGNLRWARTVGCVVADAVAALTLRPHPTWPGVVDLDARLEGTVASTRIDFDARLEVAPVILAFAREVAAPVRTGPGGLRVAGAVAPAADPTYAPDYGVADERPADALLTRGSAVVETSPVLGRAPYRLEPSDLGDPLDEAIYNPIGFRRTWDRPIVDLAPDTALTPALVRDLRDAQGVRLGPDAEARLVAGLAMSGVPTEPHDDPDAREQHSVVTRRAALLTHSTIAWRARVAERTGVRFDAFPDDVTLTTDDPDEVTDLLLARRYSGAALVVLPDDDAAGTEQYVATPPPGAMIHARGLTPQAIVAAGGLVYVGRRRSQS